MIILVKSNNLVKMFSTSDVVGFMERISTYNPHAEILKELRGTQKIVREVNKILGIENRWVEISEDILNQINMLIDREREDLLKESQDLINRRYDYVLRKIERHQKDWVENPYEYMFFQNSTNITSGLDLRSPQMKLLKTEDLETYKKAELLNKYVTNLYKFSEAKRYCRNIEWINIHPNIKVKLTNIYDENKAQVEQIIEVNNKKISYIRTIDNLDYNW